MINASPPLPRNADARAGSHKDKGQVSTWQFFYLQRPLTSFDSRL